MSPAISVSPIITPTPKGGHREIANLARDSGARNTALQPKKDVFSISEVVQLPALPIYFARISLEITEPERLWRTILETAENRRNSKISDSGKNVQDNA